MRLILVFFLCCLMLPVCAQQMDTLKPKEQKNNLSLNIGGESFGATISYQRYFINKNKWHLGAEIGIGSRLMSFQDLALPTLFGLEFGNKHRLCVEVGGCHFIDFTPNPKTKKERDEFKANPIDYLRDHYQPPYYYALSANLAYKFLTVNGFGVKIACNIIHIKSNPFFSAVTLPLPKLSFNYAF